MSKYTVVSIFSLLPGGWLDRFQGYTKNAWRLWNGSSTRTACTSDYSDPYNMSVCYGCEKQNKTKQFWYLSFSRCHFTGSYNFDGKPGYLPLVLIIDRFRSSWNQTQETVVILKETQSGVSAKSSTWPPSPFCKSSNTPCLGRNWLISNKFEL